LVRFQRSISVLGRSDKTSTPFWNTEQHLEKSETQKLANAAKGDYSRAEGNTSPHLRLLQSGQVTYHIKL
jgi:hypothetical protein